MNNTEIALRSYPSNLTEALTMLYLQNQDLTGKSPIEIHELYWETYNAISKDYRERKNTLKKL